MLLKYYTARFHKCFNNSSLYLLPLIASDIIDNIIIDLVDMRSKQDFERYIIKENHKKKVMNK